MSGGGSLGPVASVVGQLGQATPSTSTNNFVYTSAPQGNQYAPRYVQYQQQQAAPQQQQQMPNYQGGLQAALMNLMQQYNRPLVRPQMQQGLGAYGNTYRPNMAGAQERTGLIFNPPPPPLPSAPSGPDASTPAPYTEFGGGA